MEGKYIVPANPGCCSDRRRSRRLVATKMGCGRKSEVKSVRNPLVWNKRDIMKVGLRTR